MRSYYTAFIPGKFEITSDVVFGEKQNVGLDGVPRWVDNAFVENPDIEMIAIERKDCSHIWKRIKMETKLASISVDTTPGRMGILLNWNNNRHHFIEIEQPLKAEDVIWALKNGISLISREQEEGLI